jgi:hypothetical protein
MASTNSAQTGMGGRSLIITNIFIDETRSKCLANEFSGPAQLRRICVGHDISDKKSAVNEKKTTFRLPGVTATVCH